MPPITIEPPSGEERSSAKSGSTATAADATAARKPKRGGAVSAPRERLLWRAVVRIGGTVASGRERDRIEWHLATCVEPRSEGTHCNEGRHLVDTSGQPDGHCMLDGRCGRCGDTAHHAAARTAA